MCLQAEIAVVRTFEDVIGDVAKQHANADEELLCDERQQTVR